MHRPSKTAASLALLLGLFAAEARAQAASPVTLRLDYAGVEALIGAMERDSLGEADVDALLRVHGVAAMVDNVTRFVPHVGRAEFRQDVRKFARTKEEPTRDGNAGYFGFTPAWRTRGQVRALVAAIRADEAGIVRRTLADLERYRPDTGPLRLTVYFVTGGVSDGFVLDGTGQPAIYINLARAEGDLAGVTSNLAHETYHVMQKVASRRVPGLGVVADAPEKLPPGERLLANTLWEGTANYATDPTRSAATGPNLEVWKQRFRRNAEPARIAENFALFDTVLADLRAGRVTWEEAYGRGFSGSNDARFYFVGYRMAKAVEEHCGTECVRRLFTEPPVEFFRRYVAIRREHPGVGPRFAPETEAFIASLP